MSVTTTTDRTLQCRDCGATWVLTAAEQRWFENRELCEPKRCKVCRRFNKREAEARQRDLDEAPAQGMRTP